ncbi:Protein DD3-3 [Geodia barretti]|uniref:Protein DD3-3 n=1 Tax=Geodia barretti TaxID=519541 RepID=A0AA35SM25_GEOBA|nr:Protein DD3-3 [Geodia barretti]
MKAAVIFLALAVCVHADMYFHNPRGSNNRLDEAKRERNNANRMFDSQNNNRGGYNVGSLYYYTGSVLSLEWTNQHSCADPNNHCEQIVQYTCGDLVRDGATTQTIPDNPVNCVDYDCNNDIEYGMHENYDYYLDCRLRQRNAGLFIADRNLRGKTALFTRQNGNGNRRGYECPEERDYYPYWHPTPWRDVVIFTNDASRCPYYQSESQNVKSRFACVLPPSFLTTDNIRSNKPIIPNTQEGCEEVVSAEGNGTWTEFPPDSRLSAPECIETLWSRDNHLGNTIGGFPISYNWTIPDLTHEHCVLRIRYNISTGEYDGWDSAVNSSIGRTVDSVLNGATVAGQGSPLERRLFSELTDVYERFGFTYDEARERGYVFRQNPVVKVFPDVNEDSNNFGLQLAINTNQFGRTFQDRSLSLPLPSFPLSSFLFLSSHHISPDLSPLLLSHSLPPLFFFC